jgi:multimeric flavodoxin WrbA
VKKVIVLVGSARKKGTYEAARQFLAIVGAGGAVESEILFLHDYSLKQCIGCKACFEKGEDRCPLRDDRDKILAKIDTADGVVFATPNYSFQVSGAMKNFLDRLGFMFHRPRYFGKVYTNIVFQGIYGGRKINGYLDFVGTGLGFTTVKGCCLTSLEPVSAHEQGIIDRTIARQGRLFLNALERSTLPSPSILRLMMFRMSRSSMKALLNQENRDYAYYREKGWFDSDFYYPTKLSFAKSFMGDRFDSLATRTARKKV